MPHPTFAPADLTISYPSPPDEDEEDFDHNETLESKESTSAYHLCFLPNKTDKGV